MDKSHTLDGYQEIAHSYSLNASVKGDGLIYPALGLVEEAGEVIGKFKKLYRDKNGAIDDEFKEAVKKELSDCIWYLAEICTKLGIKLSDVADTNIAKILDRKSRDKIHGEGDER